MFNAVETLAASDRRELAALLRHPTGRFPLVPSEISQLPVPHDRPGQVALLTLLDRALPGALDRGLADRTLLEIVPTIAQISGSVDSAAGATNRLSALVHAHEAASWATIVAYRIDEIRSWRGAGNALVAQLMSVAVGAALDHLRVTSATQASLFDSDRSPDAMALDRILLLLTNQRQRVLFEHLDLRLDNHDLSAHHVAGLVGVGYEYGRRLRVGARAVLTNAAQTQPTVQEIVARVRDDLGEATPRQHAEAAVMSLGLGSLDDPAAMLAIWLAGPYRNIPGHPEWLSPRPGELVRHTRALLGEGGGVHDQRSTIADLIGLGLRANVVEAWLAAQPVHIDHDLVVHLVGQPTAIAERLLDASGRAMSTAELHERLPTTTAAGLAAALRRSSRFVETAPAQWELADWGGAPSQHFVRFEVDVTADVLAGQTSNMASDIASQLGLAVGAAKRFPTRFGPLALTFDGDHVHRGSIRPIALAIGACVGETLLFIVDPRHGTAEVASSAPAI